MKSQTLAASLAALFLSAVLAIPASAQSDVAIIAIDLATGRFIDPATGKIIKDKNTALQFGTSAAIFAKFLTEAKDDKKTYSEGKPLTEKQFITQYPGIKSKGYAELFFTKSSPGCNWVCAWGTCTRVCD